MFVFLSAIILILCVIHLLFNYNARARLLRKIPGPRDVFIIGNALEIMVSPVELMKLGRVFSKKWQGIYRLHVFPISTVNIFNPEDVEIVISTMTYNDKSHIYTFLKPWLRNGLLVSNGEYWQNRRKLLTPAFHFNILQQFFEVLQDSSQRLINKLELIDGNSVDVMPILSEFTLQSICETAMGTQLSEETTGTGRGYKEAIHVVGSLLSKRLVRIHLYPNILFNLSSIGRSMYKYLNIIHGFTKRVIKKRKEYFDKFGVTMPDLQDADLVYKRKGKTNMLDLLLLAEKDGHIDTDGIQEEVDTFMFEGHDTTACGLVFCLMSLANHKPIQKKIVSELTEIFGGSNRAATMDDLARMKYLECCIKESLRLYPPVHFISRNLNQTVHLSGYKIPAGTHCHIHIFDLHRSPRLYKDPLTFDPDRFLPENSVGRHPYAYIPFSAGPRNCIGQKFAMMEMKLAISGIMRKFTLLPVTTPEDIQFTADLILRNDGPIYVTFVKK